MNENDPVTRDKRQLRAVASNLNALDLAVQSQKLELEGIDLMRTLLPLFDQIEAVCRAFARRSVASARTQEDLVEGLSELAEQVGTSLGLEPIGTVGGQTHPGQHDVIDTRLAIDVPRGTILEVVQCGWIHQGKVLRRARVVAAVPSTPGPTDSR